MAARERASLALVAGAELGALSALFITSLAEKFAQPSGERGGLLRVQGRGRSGAQRRGATADLPPLTLCARGEFALGYAPPLR